MSRTEDDRNAYKERAAEELLDAYFLFRRPLPEEGFIQDNRSTQEMMDDLSPMMAIETDRVVGYMLDHDYHMQAEEDGSVRWAIWRQV